MIDKKHAYEVMEKSVEDLFALCQKFEEENAALSKDLERQVELNHAHLQEIERLRALVDMCEGALLWSKTLIKYQVKPELCVDRNDEPKSALEIYEQAVTAITAIRKHRGEE